MNLSLQNPLPTHIPKAVVFQDQTTAHSSGWAGGKKETLKKGRQIVSVLNHSKPLPDKQICWPWSDILAKPAKSDPRVCNAFCFFHKFVIVFGNYRVHVGGQRKLSAEWCSHGSVVKLETPGDGVGMLSPGKLFLGVNTGSKRRVSDPAFPLCSTIPVCWSCWPWMSNTPGQRKGGETAARAALVLRQSHTMAKPNDPHPSEMKISVLVWCPSLVLGLKALVKTPLWKWLPKIFRCGLICVWFVQAEVSGVRVSGVCVRTWHMGRRLPLDHRASWCSRATPAHSTSGRGCSLQSFCWRAREIEQTMSTFVTKLLTLCDK